MGDQLTKTVQRSRRALGLLAGAACLAGIGAAPALADMPIYSSGDFSVAGALTTGFGAFAVPDANFGTGTYRLNSGTVAAQHTPAWGEGFVKPELKMTYRGDGGNTYFGDVSAIGAGSAGTGDGNSTTGTAGHPGHFDLEEAYVGWAGDMPYGNPGDTAILTLGRQAFMVGDNFLIGSGTANQGQRAAYWLAPRNAFNGFGTLKLNAEPVRADFFLLQNSVDQHLTRGLDYPKTTFAGANVEYFITNAAAGSDGATNYADRQFYVGATYFKILDADSTGTGASGAFSNQSAADFGNALASGADRKGMNVYSMRFGGNPFSGPPAIANASLYGEYVRESNTDNGRQVNANAYYIEPGYTFSDWFGKPKFFYRYAHFSGDKNQGSIDGSGTKRAYDPLFYSAGPRDYGSWYMGEITGQYMLFNSNEDVHMIGASWTPDPKWKFLALFYRFMLDQPGQLGSTVTSRHFDDEVNLVAEYAYSSQTNFAFTLGAAQMGAGAQQAFNANANNQANGRTAKTDTYLAEASVIFNF